jgi:hypothetical protein
MTGWAFVLQGIKAAAPVLVHNDHLGVNQRFRRQRFTSARNRRKSISEAGPPPRPEDNSGATLGDEAAVAVKLRFVSPLASGGQLTHRHYLHRLNEAKANPFKVICLSGLIVLELI